MYSKFFKTTLIAALALNFPACSFITPNPTPAAAAVAQEEQAVYSFFVSGRTGTTLILQDTVTDMANDDPQQTMAYIKSGLKGISQETLNSYLARNAKSSQLSPDMNLGATYTLLSSNELSAITRQSNWAQVLSEKYPNSHGYLIFSRVGFDNSLNQAVIYVGQVAGPLMGSGTYYLLEKQKGEWKIMEQVMVWIS